MACAVSGATPQLLRSTRCPSHSVLKAVRLGLRRRKQCACSPLPPRSRFCTPPSRFHIARSLARSLAHSPSFFPCFYGTRGVALTRFMWGQVAQPPNSSAPDPRRSPSGRSPPEIRVRGCAIVCSERLRRGGVAACRPRASGASLDGCFPASF